MAVFAIKPTSHGLAAFVDGADVGREVDATKFHTPASMGRDTLGLASAFGEAVNNSKMDVVSSTPVGQTLSFKGRDFNA